MGSTSNKKTTKAKAPKKSQLKNYASWFEIPAINFDQALKFYNYIYEIDMEISKNGDYTMAFFPAKGGVGGAIVCGPGSVPSEKGSLLYLNGGDDLNKVLARVTEAGGRIIMPKTLISKESGYFALFIDIEGNKMAFHSNK
jgi:predicted enzyme related to lactoylglutathione lyase